MDYRIVSRENENIKHVKKLINSSKERQNSKQFVIEGVRLCAEAVENNVSISRIFYTHNAVEKWGEKIKNILISCKKNHMVNEDIMKSLCNTQTPQGIVCICDFLKFSDYLNNIKEYDKLVLFENIQNPSNLGAMMRTCDALNINNMIISGNSCDIYNPKLLRACMGSIFRLNIYFSENTYECIKNLNSSGFITIAMVADKSALSINRLEVYKKITIVIGNEGNGITSDVINECTKRVTIPMNEKAESLNAAVAAGIAIWEMTKSEV